MGNCYAGNTLQHRTGAENAHTGQIKVRFTQSLLQGNTRPAGTPFALSGNRVPFGRFPQQQYQNDAHNQQNPCGHPVSGTVTKEISTIDDPAEHRCGNRRAQGIGAQNHAHDRTLILPEPLLDHIAHQGSAAEGQTQAQQNAAQVKPDHALCQRIDQAGQGQNAHGSAHQFPDTDFLHQYAEKQIGHRGRDVAQAVADRVNTAGNPQCL